MQDWTPQPGLLELLENDADAETIRANASLPMRGMASDMLDDLVNWLRGFRRHELVCERQLNWVSLAELWPAPEGEATFVYKSAQTREANAELTVMAIKGFGSAGKLNLSQSIELPAQGLGRRFSVGVLLTIWRYVNEDSGDAFDRVDVVCDDVQFKWKSEDLPPEQFPTGSQIVTRAELRRQGFEIRGEYHVAGSGAQGMDTYGESAASERQWGFELEMPGLDLIQSSVSFGMKATRSDTFEVTFKLPRGYDYVFFQRASEDPIVPFCARLKG